MSKKIIAVSLALFMIVTCFVACGKKLETTIINGREVALVTDENGDPVINDKNQVIALVTDEAGKVQKYANGEDQTRYIDLDNALEIKGVAYGDKYKMNILEGWELGANSKIYKTDTEGKCYIDFSEIKGTDENTSLQTYIDNIDQQNALLLDVIKQKGNNCDIKKEAATIGEYSGWHYTYKIIDSDGKVTHYAENYYFTAGTMIYSVNYACMNGIGYDESFSFASYVSTNFIYVD